MMAESFIQVVRTEYGYCHNCIRPAWVGVFVIAGWHHCFALCEWCLGNLSRLVQMPVAVATAAAQPTQD
jgi:hypothetical protein